MYNLPALFLACCSLLAPATAKPVVHAVAPVRPAPRDAQLYSHHTKRAMVKRDANTTFDMSFEAKNVTLFSGDWLNLGLPFSLDLTCVECRTWGNLVASVEFPEDLGDLLDDLADFNPLNDASLTVAFEGVGALVDLSLTVGDKGSFTIPLFVSQTPLGVAGPGFQVGIVFSVDLVFSVTGEITTETGFQVTIPDDSSFTMPLDPTIANTARFNGTTTTLLPLTVDAPGSLSIALRLRVQAGLDLPSSPLLDAQALAGAYLNIPEIILSEEFTSTPQPSNESALANCLLPASAEININAGVFVDIGADIGNLEIDLLNPTLSTTLFSAAATTCFLSAGQQEPAPTAYPMMGTGYAAPPAMGTGYGTGGAYPAVTPAPAPADCPVPLTTETASTLRTFSITSCAAAVANCPGSLTQVIVVAEPTPATTVRCPVTLSPTTLTPTPIAAPPYANTTTVATGGGNIALTSLESPVVNTLTIDPSVVAPDATAITGAPKGGEIPVSAAASTPVSEPPAYMPVTGAKGVAETETETATATETMESARTVVVEVTTTYYTTVEATTCSASASPSESVVAAGYAV
ncbi:uncharacterized protein GGS25DRAFT_525102 [Hypoxylon fragiforme]|uniref:uncharacterized protein n=1 Tax=Hypoxylon fragiforme TaxID=63214 RepID=UPI0020C641AC|nr:uncharacterized protein GGS25DRAFT_525102 [Hypoxylon fragiforme]KAI2603829.1 hypothetical protein GGS25DRAFT_525102 [Hypoxylon fragiforme]